MENKHRILTMEKKILKTLYHRENFTKLLDAIDLCGLEDELNSRGPFTLFAPTDDAFLNMPPGLLDSLMMDKAKLADVIKHHVIQDRITSSDAITSKNAMALDGNTIEFETCNGFNIGDARVVEADIECKNGVIHIVDSVILPKEVILDHQPENVAGGSAKIVSGNGKVEQGMTASSQKMQDVKNSMKDRMNGMKEKVTGDNMSGEGIGDKMRSKIDESKNNVENKKDDASVKMDKEKTDMEIKKDDMKNKINK